MKGTNPHPPRIDWQHGTETKHHLFGSLIGEGHRQDANRGYLAGLNQPGYTGGEDAGLAAPCPSQNQG